MSISGRVGIIGSPVAHSLSPKIHNAALQSLGLDISYELWETNEENLGERIEMLRAPDILGANVTVPFKQKIIPMVNRVFHYFHENISKKLNRYIKTPMSK